MRDALDELPDRLDIEFDRTWQRIKNQSRAQAALAEKTLTWLCFARGSLRIDDIRDALGIRLEDIRMDAKGRPNSKRITNCCFGLVVLDTTNDLIRFVHYSVQEYFSRYKSERFPSGQSYIAKTCMTYLTFEELAAPCTSRQALEQRLQKYTFLRYAACHWGYHCNHSEDDELSDSPYTRIVDSPSIFDSMLQALVSFDESWNIDREKAATGGTGLISKYHFAAAYGLITILLKLFEDPNVPKIMRVDARGRYPVHNAAAFGHEGMVTLLLGMGFADIKEQDNDGRTPFALAAAAGHEGVMRVLLEEHGVNVDAKGKDGASALSLAAKGGHASAVQMLLQRGSINLNSRQFFTGTTPFMEAAWNGHLEVLQIMAANTGIKIDTTDSTRRTALCIVAEQNHLECVQALAEDPRVDPNAQDRRGQAPLFFAAWSGALEVVRYLISLPRVDVNKRSHMGETALSIASHTGHSTCVRLLMQDERVEINTLDFEKRSPLEHAVRNGHNSVARLLLSDPRTIKSTKNEWRRTPLDYAKRQKNLEIAELLESEAQQRQSQLPVRLAI